jgi:RNA polymerase sigma-70 factor (ECF subfamily)
MSNPSSDDLTRARAWADGDRNAGRALIAENYGRVVRFFQHKAGANADDLVQITFLRCSERVGTFSGTGSFRSFLFGIARNVLLEHIRVQVRDRRNEPDFNATSIADLQPGVWTQALQQHEHRMLIQALQLIPLENQMLLELYYWEELSVAEVASALEIAVGTVKSRLFRARGQLQDAMAKVPEAARDPRNADQMLQSWLVRLHAQEEPSSAR